MFVGYIKCIKPDVMSVYLVILKRIEVLAHGLLKFNLKKKFLSATDYNLTRVGIVVFCIFHSGIT